MADKSAPTDGRIILLNRIIGGGCDNGDEQINVGFAPPPGAINVAATPIRMSHYFLKARFNSCSIKLDSLNSPKTISHSIRSGSDNN